MCACAPQGLPSSKSFALLEKKRMSRGPRSDVGSAIGNCTPVSCPMGRRTRFVLGRGDFVILASMNQ